MRFIFLIIIVALLAGHAQAQFASSLQPKDNPTVMAKKTQLEVLRLSPGTNFNYSKNITGNIIDVSKPLIVIQPNYTLQHLGWYCQREFALQQQIKIPLFLRLGSKAVVDYMEGKFKHNSSSTFYNSQYPASANW